GCAPTACLSAESSDIYSRWTPPSNFEIGPTLVELCIDRVDRSHEEERIAIGRRTHDRLRSNVAGGTRPVLDDERLPKPLRQRLTNQPRSCVGRAAAGKADDDAHRPAWVALRPSEARDGRQRGNARGQMQKFPAGKFLLNLPLRPFPSITSSARQVMAFM